MVKKCGTQANPLEVDSNWKMPLDCTVSISSCPSPLKMTIILYIYGLFGSFSCSCSCHLPKQINAFKWIEGSSQLPVTWATECRLSGQNSCKLNLRISWQEKKKKETLFYFSNVTDSKCNSCQCQCEPAYSLLLLLLHSFSIRMSNKKGRKVTSMNSKKRITCTKPNRNNPINELCTAHRRFQPQMHVNYAFNEFRTHIIWHFYWPHHNFSHLIHFHSF